MGTRLCQYQDWPLCEAGIDAAPFPAHTRRMAKKSEAKSSSVVGRKSLEPKSTPGSTESRPTKDEISLGGASVLASRVPDGGRLQRPLLDTRVIYCGDNLEQLAKLPDACVDLIYIDPPFNSNRNYDGGQSG